MANNQNYSSRPAGGYSPRNNPRQDNIPPEVKALPLPADFVDEAEKIMRKRVEKHSPNITTSKIRNLFSLVSDIYNVENLRNEETLLPESQRRLSMMRIRVVYEYGRDSATKAFVIDTKLLEYMKDIGTSREKLIAFSHYMEALVAYHRYFGGKEA